MSRPVISRKKNPLQKKTLPGRIVLTAALLVICVLWLFPLFVILITSLQSDTAVSTLKFAEQYGLFLIPKHITLDSYKNVLGDAARAQDIYIARWFLNSLITSAASAILTVLVSGMAAYGYARGRFRGKTFLFGFLMFTMMIPGVVNFIPSYAIISRLHLTNNYLALILPGLSGVGNIFLIRQFLYSIPEDYDEAAMIDGAGRGTIFFRILLPQLIPVLIVVALNTFLGSWNDLLWPQLVMNDEKMLTLTAGFTRISDTYGSLYASQMACTFISAIPVMIVYLIAQKYLLQGISLSAGLKD